MTGFSFLTKDKTAAENSRNMAKIEYENAVNSIAKIYPTYEEQMKQLFNRIQDMEKNRMLYIKVTVRKIAWFRPKFVFYKG